jgi:hypothetical protein
MWLNSHLKKMNSTTSAQVRIRDIGYFWGFRCEKNSKESAQRKPIELGHQIEDTKSFLLIRGLWSTRTCPIVIIRIFIPKVLLSES